MSYLLVIKHRGGANTMQKIDNDKQLDVQLHTLMHSDGPMEVSIYKAVRTVRRRDVWDTIQAEPETR